MNAEDLCYTPATEMARLIREKALSPVELTRTLAERIQALNPRLNAYCTLTLDAALEQAQAAEQAVMDGQQLGPLHGVPYSIKDLLLTKGLRTMRGSRITEDWVPDEDAPVAERLRDAGGVLLGKTATPELGWKGVTDSPLTGVTRNPWHIEMTPGGSSGGASAQVAAGLGALAVGTDAAGSIRIPSSFTGIYGIKPSYGRVPVYPSSHHDMIAHTGPMTRTVADAALMLSVMAGPDPRDRLSLEAPPADYPGVLQGNLRGLRMAWSPDLGYAQVHPEVAALSAQAARAMETLGATVEECDPGFGDPMEFFMVIYYVGITGGLAASLEEWRGRMDPGLVRVVERGLDISALTFVQAQIARHQYYDRVRRFFEDYDYLLTPSLAVPAFPVRQVTPHPADESIEGMFAWTPFTYPFNATGQPAASLPAGFTADGLPVGLQVVGRRFDDAGVLRVSAAFEAARPWSQARPPL